MEGVSSGFESGSRVDDVVALKAVELDNLYPALVECFGIMFLGYIAGRQASSFFL